jgi:glycine betaine/proline transport system substrate-binding protein
MTILRRTRVAGGLALVAVLALVAAACAAEDTEAADAAAAASSAASSASSEASAAMAAAQGAQAGADAADARAGAAEAGASAATAAADAAAAAAAEAQAAADLAQATASGSADEIAAAQAALADAQAAAESASAQAAAAQEDAAAAQAEAATAQAEAAAAQAEAAAAQAEAAAAQTEASAAQEQAADLQAEADARVAQEAFMSPGAGVSITQARATWSSEYILSAIFHDMLEELGYEVSEPANTELANNVFYVSAAEGEVDFWAHAWLPNHDNFWDDELTDGSLLGDRIEAVGLMMARAGLEGFLTNKALVAEHGIETLGQINDDPALVALYDATDDNPGDGVIQVYSCPEGWGCATIAEETFEFNGWDNLEAVHAGYDAMFANALNRALDGDPFIAYSWFPSGYLASLIPGDNAIWLSLGGVETMLDGSTPLGLDYSESDPAALGPEFCTSDPCYTGWGAANIQVVANSAFLDANPAARALFEQVVIPPLDVTEQNIRFENGENTTAHVNNHAADWIKANRATVDEWLQAARDAA